MATQQIDSRDDDLDSLADERLDAPHNEDAGNRLRFENAAVRVWDMRLAPGERGPFHAHTRRYFWTVVDAGVGRQPITDGTVHTREYNLGVTDSGFVTVELLD